MEVEELVEDSSCGEKQKIVERKLTYDKARQEWVWSSPKKIDYSKDDHPNPIDVIKQLLESPDLQAPPNATQKFHNGTRNQWVPPPKTYKKEETAINNVMQQLLNSADLQAEHTLTLRPMPKPLINTPIDPCKTDSGVESMVSFNSNANVQKPLELMKTYLVPFNNNKRWTAAKLLYIGEDVLHLANNTTFDDIKTSTKTIAYPEPPTQPLKIGSRVVALKIQVPSTGELKRGRRRHEMGVVAEFPTNHNLHRYLIIFDDCDWLYVNPDEIWLLCNQSENVWEDVPYHNKDIVRNFLHGLYTPLVDFEKGDLVVYETSPNEFHNGVVVKVDVSTLYIWFDAHVKCMGIYKGLLNFKIR